MSLLVNHNQSRFLRNQRDKPAMKVKQKKNKFKKKSLHAVIAKKSPAIHANSNFQGSGHAEDSFANLIHTKGAGSKNMEPYALSATLNSSEAPKCLL